MTVKKEGKKNIFSGRIIEFEGGPELSVAQAYELTNASAERSAAAAAIALSTDAVANYLQENIGILNSLIDAGYEMRIAPPAHRRDAEKMAENRNCSPRG
ncbi:MAG: hypothetical protein R2874_10305 [Desulfobacterales bacterium]